MSYQRVEFELINVDNNRRLVLENDPRNWDEAERTLKRSMNGFGVMTEISRDLEFTEDGADFLRDAYRLRDIEANVSMNEYRFNPQTDARYLYSVGVFNFSEYIDNRTFVSVPFTTGGLNAIIKSKKRNKFELERLKSIQNNDIEALNVNTAALTAKELLLESELETNNQDRLSTAWDMRFSDGNFRTGFLGIPTSVKFESDDRVGGIIRDQFTTTPNNPLQATLFYLNNDIEKTLEINFTVSFRIVFRDVDDDLDNSFIRVVMGVYNGGNTPVLDSFNVLWDGGQIEDKDGVFVSFSAKRNVVLQQGQSLSLGWYGGANFGGTFSDGRYRVNFAETNARIQITEKSVRPQTRSKFVFVKDAGEKLMQILTGETGRYKSNFFENGDFKDVGLALGFWIRGFEDRRIPISFNNFVDSTNAVFNTGYTVDIVDGKETLIHEDMRYFFRQEVAIVIPGRVNNVIRSAASDFAFSEISIGYEKPSGDILYEEVNGLGSYNLVNEYNTPITRVDNLYQKESDFRADAEGKEIARRQSIDTNPTRDSRYDKDVWFLDLKRTNTEIYEERVWQDDFENAPTGIFSPSTATNLRLTPFRNLLRHGWFLRSSLTRFENELISYDSSRYDSTLATKKVNEPIRREDGSIEISELDQPMFVSQMIEFEYPIDFSLNEQIFGKTRVGNDLISNYFFKIEFTNEFGQKEYGYIMEVTINVDNKVSRFKIIKAL